MERQGVSVNYIITPVYTWFLYGHDLVTNEIMTYLACWHYSSTGFYSDQKCNLLAMSLIVSHFSSLSC